VWQGELEERFKTKFRDNLLTRVSSSSLLLASSLLVLLLPSVMLTTSKEKKYLRFVSLAIFCV